MAKNGVFLRLERSEGMVDELSSRRGDSEKVHVLAVDDSLVDRKVIEGLLRITSFKVTAVDSGWRALQFLGLDGGENSVELDRLKVDLIITDYCMPGMTGYELLKKIKGSSAFRKVPVVIMSSENVLARIHRCLEEGAEDFIVKPVKLSDIKRLKKAVFGEAPDDNKGGATVDIQKEPDDNPNKAPPSGDNTPSSPSLNSPHSDSSSSMSPTSPHSPLALLLKERDAHTNPFQDPPPHSPLALLLKDKDADTNPFQDPPHSPLVMLLKDIDADKSPSKDHPHSPLEMLLKDKGPDSTLPKAPHSPLEMLLKSKDGDRNTTPKDAHSSPLAGLLEDEENDRKPPKDPLSDGDDRIAPKDCIVPS